MMRRFTVMRPGALDVAMPAVLGEGVQWVGDGHIAVRLGPSGGGHRATVLFASIDALADHFAEPVEITWEDGDLDASKATRPVEPTYIWDYHDDPEIPKAVPDELVLR